MTEPDHYLPPPKKNNYLIIFGAFGALAVIGIVLVALYRDTPLSSDPIERARQRRAKKVVYTVVFSNVEPARRSAIADDIIASMGRDTLITDMVLGSPVADPWSANVGEYRRMLNKSMTESSSLSIGKQTQIVSMITGLLTKNTMPSTIYLVGSLNDTTMQRIGLRTEQSANAIRLRNEVIGPVTIVNMLTPANSRIHREYIQVFRDAGLKVIDSSSATTSL